MSIIEAYEVLSDETLRKKYKLSFQKNKSEYVSDYSTHWTPPADYNKYSDYDEIKNWYTKNNEIRGGMWNIE